MLISPNLSYRTNAYVHAARTLGADVLIASTGRHSLVETGIEGLHVDLNDLDNALQNILNEGRRRPFAGVVGTDDSTVELAQRAARALDLRGNPPSAAVYARRKDMGRACLHRHGVAVPAHQVMNLAQVIDGVIPELPFPVVAKPLALSASQGVIRADSPGDFRAACRRIANIVRDAPVHEERIQVLVETYVPGAEVALEGMLSGGRLTVLALFDKPEPLTGPFFEETYYITPSRLDPALQRCIADEVLAACSAYGLTDGPVHAELRVDDPDIRVIEVAARTIGGDCARLLSFGTGVSLEQLVVAQAIGEPIEFTPPTDAAGVLMIPIPRAGMLRRVEGVLDAHKVEYIEDVEIARREGYELVPLPEGGSYLGFMFARAPTPALAEAALRSAHAKLNIVTAPLWKVGFRASS